MYGQVWGFSCFQNILTLLPLWESLGLSDTLYWFPVAALTRYRDNRNVVSYSSRGDQNQGVGEPYLLLRLSSRFDLLLPAASGGCGYSWATGGVRQSLFSSSQGLFTLSIRSFSCVS